MNSNFDAFLKPVVNIISNSKKDNGPKKLNSNNLNNKKIKLNPITNLLKNNINSNLSQGYLSSFYHNQTDSLEKSLISKNEIEINKNSEPVIKNEKVENMNYINKKENVNIDNDKNIKTISIFDDMEDSDLRNNKNSILVSIPTKQFSNKNENGINLLIYF